MKYIPSEAEDVGNPCSDIAVMKDLIREKSNDDPFYILDGEELVKKIGLWRRLMPRVKIFYAVKCNDHPVVLETLANLGTGFDCASKTEIQTILDLGVNASRIIYAHPYKSISDLRFASSKKVTRMTFDSPEELQKVKLHYPGAELVLRLCCDACEALFSFGEKFGASLEDSFKLLGLAKKLKLKVVGVAFHVGSGCKEQEVYFRAITAAKQIFDEAERLGMKLHILDIGGGFPGNKDEVFEYYASVINKALDANFPELDENLEIIAEPGRYIVTTACTLMTKIIAKKTVVNEQKEITKMYYINDGVHGSFNMNLFGTELYIPTPLKIWTENSPNKVMGGQSVVHKSIVWGPTCNGFDVVKRDILLPELQCEDWLYWKDMGAYTITVCSEFNGFLKPSVHVLGDRCKKSFKSVMSMVKYYELKDTYSIAEKVV